MDRQSGSIHSVHMESNKSSNKVRAKSNDAYGKKKPGEISFKDDGTILKQINSEDLMSQSISNSGSVLSSGKRGDGTVPPL